MALPLQTWTFEAHFFSEEDIPEDEPLIRAAPLRLIVATIYSNNDVHIAAVPLGSTFAIAWGNVRPPLPAPLAAGPPAPLAADPHPFIGMMAAIADRAIACFSAPPPEAGLYWGACCGLLIALFVSSPAISFACSKARDQIGLSW